MVYLAFEKTGFYPVKSSRTLAALVNLSPDSPTQQFTTNLEIFKSYQTLLSSLYFFLTSGSAFFSATFFGSLDFPFLSAIFNKLFYFIFKI